MGDLYGSWVKDEWRNKIFDTIRKASQHTFQILTKCSENLHKVNFPHNVWQGITIDCQNRAEPALTNLLSSNAKIKFISFEPLLSNIVIDLKGIDWIIIGPQSGTGAKSKQPDKFWITNLLNEADENNIPLFLKMKLQWPVTRQEFP